MIRVGESTVSKSESSTKLGEAVKLGGMILRNNGVAMQDEKWIRILGDGQRDSQEPCTLPFKR
jgi:hypothetical protein